MVCLVIVSLQSYKNQIGTNVPDLSNSPGKLTDPFFFQQKGPATQKSLIISYQGIKSPCSTLRWHQGTAVSRVSRRWPPGGGDGTSPSLHVNVHQFSRRTQHGEIGWQIHQSTFRLFSYYSVTL